MASTAPNVSTDLSFSDEDQDPNDRLDDDIDRVRAEIQSLTKRKNQLVSSLLSSTKVQSHLNPQNFNADAGNTSGSSTVTTSNRPSDPQTPLQAYDQHNTTNVHRLAYGVTSFPFTDPNPDAVSNKPLLGIRFDILDNLTGKFSTAPYYIFLARTKHDGRDDDKRNTTSAPDEEGNNNNNNDNNNDNNEKFSIHHHTIPALIPLQDYESKYLLSLPFPSPPSSNHPDQNPRHTRSGDEGYHSPSSERNDHHDDNNNTNAHLTDQPPSLSSLSSSSTTTKQPSQNLHGFVNAVRRDLTSWHLRNDAIQYLSSRLHSPSDTGEPSNTKFHSTLQSVQATGVDARFCRLVWKNGTVARLKITNHGDIDRAVVIGDTGSGDVPDRLRDLERILCTDKDGGVLGISSLPERLEMIEAKMNEFTSKRPLEPNEEGENSDSIMAGEEVSAVNPKSRV